MSIYPEEVYGTGGMRPLSPAYPQVAYGLTADEACAQARTAMCNLGWSPPSGKPCAEATCAEIKDKVCGGPTNPSGADCTIFTGQDPIRLALCGTYTCPPPGGGGGTSSNTMIIVGAMVGVGLLAALAMTQAKKKVVIARVER